ncbi:unnamed protein product [marine sediment metagenome]|uniref:KOW domain-containing protein n=1 Tax=marine sediment metagenome TaxID=412755 RepID=X1KDE0_9ZZZZ
MKKLKIKKGDTVIVIKGKDASKPFKRRIGKVLRVEPAKNRIYVEGKNIIKKHMPRKSEQEPGGIIEKEGSIHISNVMLICSSCEKPTRVKIQILNNKEKVRICKRCGAQIP